MDTVWGALERITRGEYVPPGIIAHDTGPVTVEATNLKAKSCIQESFAYSHVKLQVHDRYLMLVVRSGLHKYALAVPRHPDNYFGSEQRGRAVLFQQVTQFDERELSIECAENSPSPF